MRMGRLLVLLLQGLRKESEKEEEPLVELEALKGLSLEEASSDKLELVVQLPSFE